MITRIFTYIAQSASKIKKIIIAGNVVTIHNGVSRTTETFAIDMERPISFPEFDFLADVPQSCEKISGSYRLIQSWDYEHRYLPRHVLVATDIKHFHLVRDTLATPDDVACLMKSILEAKPFNQVLRKDCLGASSRYSEACNYYFEQHIFLDKGLEGLRVIMRDTPLFAKEDAAVLLDDYKQFFAENQEVLQREFNQNAAAVAQDKKAFQQKVEAGIHLYLVMVLSLGITAGMTALREVMLKKGVKREHADHTIDALLLLSIAVTSPDITPTLIGYAIQSFIDIFSKAERKPYLKMAAGVGLLMMTSDSLFSLYGLLKFSLTTAASVLATNIVTPYISEFFKSKPEASANNQHVVSMQKYGQ